METIIEISHLGKSFSGPGGTVVALEDINLTIQKGEIFGIIGLSGAGKSTLVRCINYLEKPTSGDVIFEGRSLTAMSEKEIRRTRQSMGMIFQQFNLLAQRSILKNVCFPMEIAGVPGYKARERALELLDLVGLSDKAKAYPSQLSGGQQQRVAIARAIATNPKLLLCDEATSALDPNTTQQILSLIRDINRRFRITVVIITHEMRVIESVCDRVAIIDNSRIAELGKVSDIFADPKSAIGKNLILSDTVSHREVKGGRMLRIVFDGRNSLEPVISNMILSCKVPVNILHASTKDIQGTAHGHMIIQLPEDELSFGRLTNYLRSVSIAFEEVTSHES